MKQHTESIKPKRQPRYKAPKTAEPGHLWLLYDQWQRTKYTRESDKLRERFERELRLRQR